MKHTLLILSALLFSRIGLAQTPPTDSTAVSPVTVYGFLDAYYGFDFPTKRQQRPAFLYSHNRANEFALNNGLLGIRYQQGSIRGALALQAGTYVEANYAAEPEPLRHVYEAYAGFQPTQNIWLDMGIFSSHIGFESAISKDNWTLTRSVMAENSPYYEAGVRLTYTPTPRLTLTGLVLNGWQNLRDNNRGKALGTQLQWKLTDRLLLNSSTFYGNEQPQDSARRRRFFHDFYVTYETSKRLQLALVFDVGLQEAPNRVADTWHTGAALARFQLSAQWQATARAEYYHSRHGVVIQSSRPLAASPLFQVAAASLTTGYAPTPQLLVRLEGRVWRGKAALFDPTAMGAATHTYGSLTSSMALSF
ncbi:hypothetical protein PK28_10625 [Hymenobacter sp. DG25B]|uniref:porin n=1 Tax=Hymenobacter sp. DG25B TaxID=1385664 RepID=UPI0005412805|nr:porin [Hymenobacter sp. DG25B]AIZ64036.1 hypothetical protein PK28_10625 [Hymenobacter sp. DG25B]